MANPNIFAQHTKPVRSLQDYANDYDVAEQNKLALAAKRMEMQKAQLGMADADAVRGIAQQYGGDENALIRAYRQGGFLDQAAGLEKSIAERLKAKADAEKTGADTRKSDAETQAKGFELAKNRYNQYRMALGALAGDPALAKEKVIGVAGGLVDAGILTPELAQKLTANLPDDLEALRADIIAGRDAQLSPEQQSKLFAPEFSWQDSGQQKIPVQMNPRAPGYTAPQTIQKVATPGEVLTDTRTRAEGAANRGVTIRGQNLTDSRAREGLRLQGERLEFDKKNPTEKPLNDTQSKALLFGSRMREADKVLEALARDGTTTSVPGSRAGYGVGSVVTALSSAPKQQIDQAKRDFVNAVLRRESGAVIADSEFDNADKQYFPQIGDSKEVIAQKARNRKLAIDGILQEVPENRRNSLQPTPQMPTADDIRKQADNILKGG